jgi:ankyrin repeat protein
MFLTNDNAHLSLEALKAWMAAKDDETRAWAAEAALCVAMQSAPDDALDHLLTLSNDVCAEKFGRFPLGEAARYGRARAVEALIAKGADVNRESSKPLIHQDGEEGYRPLLLAIEGGHRECVALLLERGAEPSFKTKNGVSPVEFARAKGHDDIAQLLGAAGAQETSHDDLTLVEAALRGLTKRVAELVPAADSTALWDAACKAVEACHVEVLEALLPAMTEAHQHGLLRLACYHGHPAVCRLLLTRGAPVEGPEGDGEPLQTLLANAKPEREAPALELMRMLLDAGATVDTRTGIGMTPLMQAAQTAFSLQAAELLIEAGADLYAKDSKKYDPLKWAKWEYAGRDKAPMVKLIGRARREAKKRAKAAAES